MKLEILRHVSAALFGRRKVFRNYKGESPLKAARWPQGVYIYMFWYQSKICLQVTLSVRVLAENRKKWPWVEISEIYRLYLTIGKIWKYENISCSCCERAGARTLQAEGPKTKIWYKEYVVVVLVVVVVVVVLLLLLLLLILILILQTLQLHYLKVGIRGNEVNI